MLTLARRGREQQIVVHRHVEVLSDFNNDVHQGDELPRSQAVTSGGLSHSKKDDGHQGKRVREAAPTLARAHEDGLRAGLRRVLAAQLLVPCQFQFLTCVRPDQTGRTEDQPRALRKPAPAVGQAPPEPLAHPLQQH